MKVTKKRGFAFKHQQSRVHPFWRGADIKVLHSFDMKELYQFEKDCRYLNRLIQQRKKEIKVQRIEVIGRYLYEIDKEEKFLTIHLIVHSVTVDNAGNIVRIPLRPVVTRKFVYKEDDLRKVNRYINLLGKIARLKMPRISIGSVNEIFKLISAYPAGFPLTHQDTYLVKG